MAPPLTLDEVRRVCHDPVQRLMRVFIRRQRLSQDAAVLTDRTLRRLVMWLRAHDPAPLAGLSEDELRTLLVWHAARMLWGPVRSRSWWRRLQASVRAFGRWLARLFGSRPQEQPARFDFYSVRELLQPLDWVGGDCRAVEQREDGTLWVLVADVTNHSWPAYLLASGLPDLLRWCLRRPGAPGGQPGEVLNALEAELDGCLPESIFVEAGLARLRPEGAVTVAVAGAVVVLRREAGTGTTGWHELGDWLLGMGGSGSASREQQSWQLSSGDELTLASDGLFDQPAGDGRLRSAFLERLDSLGPLASLHDQVVRLLRTALKGQAQQDDITVVTVRRHDPASSGGTNAPV